MERDSWRCGAAATTGTASSSSRNRQSLSSSSSRSYGKKTYHNNPSPSTTSPSSSSSTPPPSSFSATFTPVIGKSYHGKVWNVITSSSRIGLYCKFGEVPSQWFARDGFVRNIISKPTGQLYQRGDDVELQCLSTSPLLFALLPSYVRPLLILDVNGPLGNRTPYEGRSGSRHFVPRKYTAEFLELCSQYFELAVWSCAKRNNIELELFSKHNLHFVWSQEESTSLYPRTSFVSPAKPLFLKELAKVFEKFPSYNYSNTVLLENHLEKFERNTFGSGIICPDFDTTRVDEDELLNPLGELAQHLIAMATQHPINILQYIRAYAGSSTLFPTEYPTPPDQPDNASPVPVTTSAPITQGNIPQMNLVSDHELLWNYLLHTCNQNPKVAQQCIDQKSLPGPKATPFRCSHLTQIKQSPENYVVCEKTDGDRAILVISPEHGEIYFVYRNHTVERLDSNAHDKKDWLRSLPGITVFDGELVSGYSQSTGAAAYLCFDAIFLNGQFIGNQSNYSLLDRMRCADEWFKQSAIALSNIFLKQHPTIRSSLPLLFLCKNMLFVKDIDEVTAKMTPNISDTDCGGAGYWGWVYGSPLDPQDPQSISFPHLCDGLVFTPINLNYYEYLAIKWKPCHMCTNDYWLSLSDLRKLGNRTGGRHDGDLITTGYLPLSNKQTESKIPMSQVKISPQLIREVLSPGSRPTGPSHVIGECFYDKRLSIWRVYKIRDDKATPNSLQAAWSNLEVISEGLELSTILQSLGELKSTQQQKPVVMSSGVNIVSNSQVGAVDKHYDQIQQFRHQQRGSLESRIAMHRKVMNWSKACLLQQTLMSSSPDRAPSLDYYHSLINQALSALQANTRLISPSRSSSSPNFLKAGRQSQTKKRSGGKLHIHVVDLACGRGGDIKKFTSESKVGSYLGIDISGEQIKECVERTKENRSIFSSSFHHGDAGDGQWHVGYPEGSYDITWCMFAFHYFCDTELHCRNLFGSVASLLKPQGKFVLTFPNPFAIHDQLTSSATETLVSEEKEPICTVRYQGSPNHQDEESSATQGFPHSLDDCLNQFGIQYFFTLGDAVQDCPEFLVPLRKVLELAQEYHFYLLPSSESVSGPSSGLISMNQWIEEVCLANDNYLSLRNLMQVCGAKSPGRNVTPEEWNAISLYCCLTFVKLPE